MASHFLQEARIANNLHDAMTDFSSPLAFSSFFTRSAFKKNVE